MATNESVKQDVKTQEVKDIESMSKKQLLELARQQALLIAEKNAKLATAKVTKTVSDFFCSSKDESTAIAYKNLSETKKYCEDNFSDDLRKICESENVAYLTSKVFHKHVKLV